MQIVENWAELKGFVLDVAPSREMKRFHAVELQIEQVNKVEGFPNLLEDLVDRVVTVFVHSDVVLEKGIINGCVITCRVRKTSGQKLFVHRDYVKVE